MSRFRRALATACLVLGTIVFAPIGARADVVRADFDGDGVRDHIDVAARFTELDVRLSKSAATQHLRANDFILRFVIADVDRDGRLDVIAQTERQGLQIWINTGRGHFAARSSKGQGLRRGVPLRISGSSRRCDDDSACNDPTRELISSSSPRGQPLIASCRASAAPLVREFRFQHSPRIARGPPVPLFATSIQRSF